MGRTKMDRRLIVAKASAYLPKGYTAKNAQAEFIRAVESYGDHADAAAVLLYECAVANLTDNNRRGGPSTILDALGKQMRFLIGQDATGGHAGGIEVVTIGGEGSSEGFEEINDSQFIA